jgi:hypothetical protein
LSKLGQGMSHFSKGRNKTYTYGFALNRNERDDRVGKICVLRHICRLVLCCEDENYLIRPKANPSRLMFWELVVWCVISHSTPSKVVVKAQGRIFFIYPQDGDVDSNILSRRSSWKLLRQPFSASRNHQTPIIAVCWSRVNGSLMVPIHQNTVFQVHVTIYSPPSKSQ